eukprot:scaffold117576_cov63-Phaeocystis_antarctica.AAC.1
MPSRCVASPSEAHIASPAPASSGVLVNCGSCTQSAVGGAPLALTSARRRRKLSRLSSLDMTGQAR